MFHVGCVLSFKALNLSRTGQNIRLKHSTVYMYANVILLLKTINLFWRNRTEKFFLLVVDFVRDKQTQVPNFIQPCPWYTFAFLYTFVVDSKARLKTNWLKHSSADHSNTKRRQYRHTRHSPSSLTQTDDRRFQNYNSEKAVYNKHSLIEPPKDVKSIKCEECTL